MKLAGNILRDLGTDLPFLFAMTMNVRLPELATPFV